MSKLADAFKKLEKITPQLNRATDAANEAYRTTEELLAKFGIGAEVEVMRLGESSGFRKVVERKLALVYDRIGQSYRIGFKVIAERSITPDGDPENWEFMGAEVEQLEAWDQAGRHWKLAGIVVLADLIEAIGVKAEALSGSAEIAAQTVSGILRDLKEAAVQAEFAKRNSIPPTAVLVALKAAAERARE